jgi:hypothetical protein
MSVINKGVDLAILFLIGAYLIVPYAITFVNANWTGVGLSASVVSGIVLILLIVFLFRQVKGK